jgi:thiol-disulfide isomerase/thioredoxin
MKKIIKLSTTFSFLLLITNSLLAQSYYPSSYSNYSYGQNYTQPSYSNYGYGQHYTQPSYSNYSYGTSWQYPSSYNYTQGCPTTSYQGNQTRSEPQQISNAPEKQYSDLIIMFTKDNCPYCVYMKPIMQEAQAKFGNNIKFLFLDITQNPHYAAQYGFSTVPHVVYFKNGQQLDAHGSGNKTMTIQQVEQRIRNLGLGLKSKL